MKKVLLALALVVSATGASYAQTAGQAVMGFLLAQGSTYNSYTCPSTNPTPCFVQYGSNLPTSSDTLQNVSETPTSSAINAITSVVSQGVSTLLGKASAGNLYTVYYTSTADTWLMVFNSTSAPTDGATTAGTASGNMQDCVKVPSGTSVSIGGLPIPERFSTGIYFAASSTECSTLTLATTGLFHAMVQ